MERGIDIYFKQNGYIQCLYKSILYIKINENGDIILISLYIDDLIFSTNNPLIFKEFKKTMACEFDMIDTGLMFYFLIMEVNQSKEGTFITQKGYAKEILNKFKINDCNLVRTPVELVLGFQKMMKARRSIICNL